MSRICSAALSGIDGVPVDVEVRISSQLPRVEIVGLPQASVRESTARVRAAIASSGFRFPDRRVTINLAPAELPKHGAGLDLAIAIGILRATGALDGDGIEHTAFFGELALDGRLRPIRGALALVIAARRAGCTRVVVPAINGEQAALAPGLDVRTAADFPSVVAQLTGSLELDRAEPPEPRTDAGAPCISEVRGQEQAKRAIEIAAAGEHGILLSGPPGAGKSMLARRLPGLLPALTPDETLEIQRIYDVRSEEPLSETTPLRARPFRTPHHSASQAGLLGGGNPPRPGEVTLAHRGVLFLDELAEFQRRSLESLRQVMEEHRVVLSRAAMSCVMPARFQLVAACNPCACGWYRSGVRDCRCDDGSLARYQRRLSGPLLDRIDLHVEVGAIDWNQLDRPSPDATTSHEVAERIVQAREFQRPRGSRSNAEIRDSEIDEIVCATPDARRLLGRAVGQFHISARGARRALRIARTIADLRREPKVGPRAMAEALAYRSETRLENP